MTRVHKPRAKRFPGRAKRASVISPAAQHVAAGSARKTVRKQAIETIQREQPDKVADAVADLIEILGVVTA